METKASDSRWLQGWQSSLCQWFTTFYLLYLCCYHSNVVSNIILRSGHPFRLFSFLVVMCWRLGNIFLGGASQDSWLLTFQRVTRRCSFTWLLVTPTVPNWRKGASVSCLTLDSAHISHWLGFTWLQVQLLRLSFCMCHCSSFFPICESKTLLCYTIIFRHYLYVPYPSRPLLCVKHIKEKGVFVGKIILNGHKFEFDRNNTKHQITTNYFCKKI